MVDFGSDANSTLQQRQNRELSLDVELTYCLSDEDNCNGKYGNVDNAAGHLIGMPKKMMTVGGLIMVMISCCTYHV